MAGKEMTVDDVLESFSKLSDVLVMKHHNILWDMRKLACAVIARAVKDIANGNAKPKVASIGNNHKIEKHTAYISAIDFVFKTPSPFDTWCYMARLDPVLMRKLIKPMLTSPKMYKKILEDIEKIARIDPDNAD